MKNIVVCADLTEESITRLRDLHRDLDLKHTKVHIIHVFEIQYYMAEFSPYVYPAEEQYNDIEKSSVAILEKLGHDMGLSSENFIAKCFFARSVEEKVHEYLKVEKAEMAVVATRGKHGIDGLFSSSLSDFLVKYSPCDVLVLRPKC